LVIGSHVLVLNPGVEICAPDWVASALLCTSQPLLPRSETSVAPVADDELGLAAAGAAAALLLDHVTGLARPVMMP